MNKKEQKMHQRHSGFTIVEIIIVVSVMGILAAMTTPAIVQMIQKRDQATELSILNEITDALQRYSADNNEIPSDNPTDNPNGDDWATLIAAYTNYSAEQLRKDSWGHDRAYLSHEESERFIDTDVTISYATLHSRGVNQTADEGGTHIGYLGGIVDGFRTYAGRQGGLWWSNQADEVTAFSNVEPGGDDLMVKFTNYQNVVNNYNITLERMKKLGEALAQYAQSMYTEAAIANTDSNVHTRIYFPRSQTQQGGDSGSYSSDVLSDMGNYSFGSDNRVYSRSNNATRRNEMIQLTRLLGLPDSYCCNAMERFTSGGESYEVPFYYFSNPRPRASSGCGTRPSTGGNNLPPRIVLRVYGSGNSLRTCG